MTNFALFSKTITSKTLISLIMLPLLLLHCQQDDAGNIADNLPGYWRMVAEVPGGDLPFGVEIESAGAAFIAYVINGKEPVAFDDVALEGATLRMEMPAFNSRIELKPSGDGLAGTLTLTKRGGVLQVMPLSAQKDLKYRFFAEGAPPAANITGQWKVQFVEPESQDSSIAIGQFQQEGSYLEGTFLTPTGDYRFLAGEVRGNKAYLSCFDGGHAFLFTAEISGDQIVNGHFWSGLKWHENWTARRDTSFSLPDANELTFLKPGYERLQFRFPDLDSNMVSLDDPRFDGKVKVITIVGSWCPNCHDEAAFLSPLYKDYRERGLEIIALMYEHFKEFPKATAQVKRFRKKFGIEYETLIAGYSSKSAAAETLPMLNHVLSYPTTIFIDKKGAVRKIHTGFTGPGTGSHYQNLTVEFKQTIEELLSE